MVQRGITNIIIISEAVLREGLTADALVAAIK